MTKRTRTGRKKNLPITECFLPDLVLLPGWCLAFEVHDEVPRDEVLQPVEHLHVLLLQWRRMLLWLLGVLHFADVE